MDSISQAIDNEFDKILKHDDVDIPVYVSKKFLKYHTLVLFLF